MVAPNLVKSMKSQGHFEENEHEDLSKCFTTCEHEQQIKFLQSSEKMLHYRHKLPNHDCKTKYKEMIKKEAAY